MWPTGRQPAAAPRAHVGIDALDLFRRQHSLPRRHPFVHDAVGDTLDEHVVGRGPLGTNGAAQVWRDGAPYRVLPVTPVAVRMVGLPAVVLDLVDGQAVR